MHLTLRGLNSAFPSDGVALEDVEYRTFLDFFFTAFKYYKLLILPFNSYETASLTESSQLVFKYIQTIYNKIVFLLFLFAYIIYLLLCFLDIHLCELFIKNETLNISETTLSLPTHIYFSVKGIIPKRMRTGDRKRSQTVNFRICSKNEKKLLPFYFSRLKK